MTNFFSKNRLSETIEKESTMPPEINGVLSALAVVAFFQVFSRLIDVLQIFFHVFVVHTFSLFELLPIYQISFSCAAYVLVCREYSD